MSSTLTKATLMPTQGRNKILPFLSLNEYEAMGLNQSSLVDSLSDMDEAFMDQRLDQAFNLMRQCHQFHGDFGYVVPTHEVMNRLALFFRPLSPVMDAGCGSGFLSHHLAGLGIEMVAVDITDHRDNLLERRPSVRHVLRFDLKGNAAELLSPKYGAVLMSWPPHQSSFALDVAHAMHPGQFLVFEGEFDGPSANKDLLQELSNTKQWKKLQDVTDDLNAVHVRFPTMNDHWGVWEKLPG